jgi:hypothetical protein
MCLKLTTGFRQMEGWVYLNCCSTPLMTVWQSAHTYVPNTSSGCTGCVLTTWGRIYKTISAKINLGTFQLQVYKIWGFKSYFS